MFVSAIVTAKGIPDFINTALDSLLAQTRQPDEVIVVLDGPRDSTADVVKSRMDEIGYQIPNQIITCSSNEGTAATRNKGIAAARGDVVCFLDGDDWYLPCRIEKGLEFMNCYRMVENADILAKTLASGCEGVKQMKASFCNFYWLDERGKFQEGKSYAGSYKELLTECFVRPNQMIKYEVFEEIGLFDPSYPQAEDYDFWERYLRKYDIAFNPQPLFVYRRHRKAKVASDDGYIRANKERVTIQERIRNHLQEKGD